MENEIVDIKGKKLGKVVCYLLWSQFLEIPLPELLFYLCPVLVS